MWRLELVANILYFSPTTWYEFEQQSSNFKERTVLQCKAMTSVYTTGISIQKTVSILQGLHYSINAKKICLSSTCINKKCHDMIHSDCEWKSFLSLSNKPDFSSEHFSNLLHSAVFKIFMIFQVYCYQFVLIFFRFFKIFHNTVTIYKTRNWCKEKTECQKGKKDCSFSVPSVKNHGTTEDVVINWEEN